MTGRNVRVLALGLALSGIAAAAEGDLDSSFGTNGVALTGLTDAFGGVSECAPVLQPDGKILLCGTRLPTGGTTSDFFVARFTADGQLDPDFSFDGRVSIDFDGGTGGDLALALALQSDGKIVVVGSSRPTISGKSDFAIARLLPDGTLDPAFGAGTGKKLIAFDLDGGDGNDDATDVAIQPDGKIVVAGTVDTLGNGTDFGVARLQPDGTLDSSFNLSGKVSVGFNLAGSSTFNDSVRRMAIDAAGRIVVAGNADNGQHGTDFAVLRLQPNGQPDPNFNANGRSTVAFDVGATQSDLLLGMTLQHDGRIVLAGAVDVAPGSTPNTDFGVARLLPDGTIDSAFGFAGRTIVAFDLVPSGGDLGIAVIQQSDGKLDIGGAATFAGNGSYYAAMVQLNADGTPDTGFGTLGKRTYDLGLLSPGTQAILGLGFQGTRILASGIAGVSGPTDGVDNFVIRLETDLIFANGFD